MGRSWHKESHSSMMERCHRELLSGLPPPNNFSIQPHDLVKSRRPWPVIHAGGAYADPVTKSWLPTGTRCGGPHRPPLLRHVSTGPPETHAPRPQGHRFLSNPDDILGTPLEMLEASHWRCVLKEYSNAKKQPELDPSDDAGLKLQLEWVSLGPNAPCSGLTVSYSVVRDEKTSASLGWRWTRFRQVSIGWECVVSDPFDSRGKQMEFTSVVRCGGKWYAITLQGAVAVMELFGRRLRITGIGSTRAAPSSGSRFFKEYLVEMKGELLMVYLIHHESIEVVDDVEVFRLNLDKLHWIKVERLRGKTMFLKESGCVWVESAEFGCRDDCVFFTQGKEGQWRVYDMKKCLISSVL